mgnify:CR=1 FL=1
MEGKNQKNIFKEGKRYYADCFSCYDSSFVNTCRSKYKFSAKQ